MAVLLDTSMGELVIDLFVNECPIASTNFLKLCKIKYYNGCLFYNVQSNFIAQTGDPTGTGKGGTSIYGILEGPSKAMFRDEINKQRKLNKIGLVLMAHSSIGENSNKSQFFITLRGEDYFDFEGKYTVFGEVAEGFEVLEKLNEVYCDEDGRPYQDIRIRHTAILDDPFPDPAGLQVPDSSPEREYPVEEKVKRRIRYEDDLEAKPDGKSEAEIEQSIKRKEAQSRAIVLEMTGDLPDAEAKPPAEVLFVCKLNPVTRDEDLELIFSRFGVIKSCEIIRDFKTGDSLNYAFIEFDSEGACIEAYHKMNNVLIDDRRIKVDFSQSVSHLWNRFLLQPRNKLKPKSATSTSSAPPHKPSNDMPNRSVGEHKSAVAVESKKRHRSRSDSRERPNRDRDDRSRRDRENSRHREHSDKHRDRHRDGHSHRRDDKRRSRSRERKDDYRRR
jgi:peptidyl-prolyl cis-trans isomerase-like 4